MHTNVTVLTQCAGVALLSQSLYSPQWQIRLLKAPSQISEDCVAQIGLVNARCKSITSLLSTLSCLLFNLSHQPYAWSRSHLAIKRPCVCVEYFENDKIIDFTICSQSLGADITQQEPPPHFISHCKWMCPPLSPHLYSLQEPSLPHSEGLSLLCLSHLPSVSPVTGQLRSVPSHGWSAFTMQCVRHGQNFCRHFI